MTKDQYIEDRGVYKKYLPVPHALNRKMLGTDLCFTHRNLTPTLHAETNPDPFALPLRSLVTA